MSPSPSYDGQNDEQRRVVQRRYLEAREAGLTRVEAHLFAESDQDVGTLRMLVAGGCPPAMIARIVV